MDTQQADAALADAAEAGDVRAVVSALSMGADVNCWGGIALKKAAENGHTDVVNLLIRAGADVQTHGDYILVLAARAGHLGAVQALLAAGAHADALDNYALQEAQAGGHTAVAEALLAAAPAPAPAPAPAAAPAPVYIQRSFPAGKLFYHGSPFLFPSLNPGSYIAAFPTLSLAILTEKANGVGYLYVMRARTEVPIPYQHRSVEGLFFNVPTPVDALAAEGKDYPPENLIARTDVYYDEFVVDSDENFILLMIYQIDIEQLRARVKSLARTSISESEEDLLIQEFLPTNIVLN